MRRMIKKLAVVLSVVLVCAPMGAMAANKLIVKGTDGTTDKLVVTDTGFIGVGTSAPSNPLTIKGNSIASSSIQLSYDGNATYNRFYEPEMRFSRNNINDPAQNNGLAFNGDRLGFFSFGTIMNSTFKQSAGIFTEAAENHTTGSFAGNLYLATTPPNGTYAAQRVTILSTGNVGVGTVTPSQKFEVNGGIRLNTTTGKPLCDVANASTRRGTLWFTQAGAGAADTVEICAKDSAGNYAWKLLF